MVGWHIKLSDIIDATANTSLKDYTFMSQNPESILSEFIGTEATNTAVDISSALKAKGVVLNTKSMLLGNIRGVYAPKIISLKTF